MLASEITKTFQQFLKSHQILLQKNFDVPKSSDFEKYTRVNLVITSNFERNINQCILVNLASKTEINTD